MHVVGKWLPNISLHFILIWLCVTNIETWDRKTKSVYLGAHTSSSCWRWPSHPEHEWVQGQTPPGRLPVCPHTTTGDNHRRQPQETATCNTTRRTSCSTDSNVLSVTLPFFTTFHSNLEFEKHSSSRNNSCEAGLVMKSLLCYWQIWLQ